MQRPAIFDRPVERAMDHEDALRAYFGRDGVIDDDEAALLGGARSVVTETDQAAHALAAGLTIIKCGNASWRSEAILKEFPGAWPEEDDPQAA